MQLMGHWLNDRNALTFDHVVVTLATNIKFYVESDPTTDTSRQWWRGNAGPVLRIGAGESRSQVMSSVNRDLFTRRRMLQVGSLGAGAAIAGFSGKRLGAFAQATPDASPDASVFDPDTVSRTRAMTARPSVDRYDASRMSSGRT